MKLDEIQTVYPDTSYWIAMRSGDVVHVAVAKLCGADLFVTCDADQCALAEAAGLEAVLVGRSADELQPPA